VDINFRGLIALEFNPGQRKRLRQVQLNLLSNAAQPGGALSEWEPGAMTVIAIVVFQCS